MIQAAFGPEFDDPAAIGRRPLQQYNLWAEFTPLFTNNFPDTTYKVNKSNMLFDINIVEQLTHWVLVGFLIEFLESFEKSSIITKNIWVLMQI